MKRLEEIEAYFHEKIPLSKAMGVRVIRYTGEAFELQAPLSANYNHLGTAFGGSLSALATLAAYGLLWLELSDPSAHVVIKESQIQYRKPVVGDLRAVCYRPDAEALAHFRHVYQQKKRARIELRAEVLNGEEVAMEFTGLFVAIG